MNLKNLNIEKEERINKDISKFNRLIRYYNELISYNISENDKNNYKIKT